MCESAVFVCPFVQVRVARASTQYFASNVQCNKPFQRRDPDLARFQGLVRFCALALHASVRSLIFSTCHELGPDALAMLARRRYAPIGSFGFAPHGRSRIRDLP